MKAKFLTADKSENLSDDKAFLFLPVILSCEFENLGQFNIVVMRPDGVGSAFYGGWAKPEKNTLNRSWTLPIYEGELQGQWQVIGVLRTKDGFVEHFSLEGDLTEGIKPISQKKVEKVPFKMNFPVKDITVPYPTLWVSGKASEAFELTVKEKSYQITPDASNNFLLPIELEFGSYTLIDIEGGEGTPGFRSSYSIFSIKGSFDTQVAVPEPVKMEKKFQVVRKPKLVPLELHIPAIDNKTSKESILIEGKTAGKATLLINGQEIATKKGKFTEELTLRDGDNELAFTATLGDNTLDERVIVTKTSDKPLYFWEYPVDDLVSAKKTQLIKGWAQLDCEIVIDGKIVPLAPIDGLDNIGRFELNYPIRIGINEIEIVVQNQTGTVRESKFLECDTNRLTFGNVKKFPKIIQTFDNKFRIQAQVTSGSSVVINTKEVTPGVYGEIDTTIELDNIGSNDVKIEIAKNEFFADEYPPVRSSKQLLADIHYINDRQAYYLQSKNIESIESFFTYKEFISDIDKAQIEIDQVYQLQKYLGFLLISKNNLALFGEEEAYLLSQTEIRSIEELVSMDPVELVEKLNKLAENNNINMQFAIGDANRWQRTLDDLLFEFQEEYLS